MSMDPHQELSAITVPPVPAESPEAIPVRGATQQHLPLSLFAGLIIATACVYGMLTWSDAKTLSADSQTAAVSEVLPTAFDSLGLEAHSAFVVNLSENKIVHTKNADVQLPLASLTKVMLSLVVSEVLKPDDIVSISESAVLRGEGGGPAAGETWLVKDLLDYTLVVSSNVGAEALAEAANEKIRARYPGAPEEDATVWRMGVLAKELGLSKTYFLNASGLDIGTTQPSAMGSARDATILLAYAYKTHADLFAATRNATLTVGPIDGPKKVELNTNDVTEAIPGLVMGKTGYTDLAGGNLGIVFTSALGEVFVATVLGSTQAGRFTDMLSIVTAAER